MNKNEKSKIEGVDNNELLLFCLILGGIIILLIFEFFFFEGRSEVVADMAQVGQQLQGMKGETLEAEEKTVHAALTDIISKMNNNEYKSLYEMLKEDYKNYYFREYNEFEEFIKVYAGQNYYPKYGSYYRDGDLYYIMVEFLQDKYTREELLSKRTVKVDTIVLEEQEDGNFKFAMNGFVENILHKRSKTVEGVTFILLNSVRNTETMKTTVMVKNDSDKAISVSTTNLQPNILGVNVAKVSVTSSINLEPEEIGSLEIEYYFQYNEKKAFDGLTISGVKFDDGTVIEDIYLAK